MAIEIYAGVHRPMEDKPGRDRWSFDASIDGQHGIVEFSAPSGTGDAQAREFAHDILARYPERLQGITSTHGVHDVWRVQIKNDPRLAALPVILMTSRADEEDIRRGLELGAGAYLTKQKFDQRELLATIGQLL